MVIREFIKCLTCDFISTIRVSVGHNSYQRHDFSCEGCEEPIGVGMNIDFKKPSAELEFCENCERADEEGSIVNLDPHFVIPEADLSEDLNFAWMGQVGHIRNNSEIKPILKKDTTKPPFFIDTYIELGGIMKTTEVWSTVKKAWSLHSKKKTSLAERVLKKYDLPGFSGRKSFDSVITDFIYRLTLPKGYPLTDIALSALDDAKNQYPDELKRFVKYYIENIKLPNNKRYFDTFSEFFDNFSEYDQSILYVKNASPVPENNVATSYGFDRTKMFYGNAYENYTSNIVVLACLNNITSGRPFDQFNSMDLTKYVEINKANRGNPFADNIKLNPFLVCTDSTLRNASHHKSIHLVDKGRNIEYQSGGTGALRKISYSKYLEKCNVILLSVASLYLFETELVKCG